jgi:hypothetical protein
MKEQNMKGLRTGHHEGQDEKGWDRTGLRHQDIFLHLQMMTCMVQGTFRPDYGRIFARPVEARMTHVHNGGACVRE